MIIDWLPNLLLGWGVQLIGVLSPGPGVALIMAVATTHGRFAALTSCVGIALGAAILATIGILGLAALLADIAWAMTAVKLAGATFLAWLAWKSFGRMLQPEPLSTSKPVSTEGRKMFLVGLAMQLTNPKAIIYWIAAVAVAGLESAPLIILAIFVVGGFANSFVGHGLWAVALSSKPFLTFYQRARRWVEGTLGVFFAFAAFKLATSRT